MGKSQAFLCIVEVAGSWGTFIQGHDDICSDASFDIHYLLWCEHMLTAIDMTAECTSFLRKFPDSCQREDLKAAAVG